MEINDELILKLERLAKLSLKDDERKLIQNDLANILTMVEKLKEVDTKDVEPLRYLTLSPQGAEKDQHRNFDNKMNVLASAPKLKDNQLAIPKVISKD